MNYLSTLKGGLIVSCQALEDEPLHSSFIMSKMALAAEQGGAVGIRANSKKDIIAIRAITNLPIIGIIKRNYSDSSVFITPTFKEIEELSDSGCDIIALDATLRMRPNNEQLTEIIVKTRQYFPKLKLMADCSTVEEAVNANKLGFNYIGTTLVGYTEESQHLTLHGQDYKILRDMIKKVDVPVIAEGNVLTPEMAQKTLMCGAYSVVVGSMITRPQILTRKFVDKIKQNNSLVAL